MLAPRVGQWLSSGQQELQSLATKKVDLQLPSFKQSGSPWVLAKLAIGGKTFWGLNTARNVTIGVNAISRDHAEAGVFNEAFEAGIRGAKYARLVVDRNLCKACDEYQGVVSMAKQIGVQTLEIVTPYNQQIIDLGKE